MHVFVDESGSFTIPRSSGGPAISCVGAVVLPSSELEVILAGFRTLAACWAPSSVEVKGRTLNEEQTDAFLAFLAERQCLIVCNTIDLAQHRVAEVEAHRDEQARRVSANLSEEHHPRLKESVRALEARLRGLKTPNYVQLLAYTSLVETIIRDCTLFLVQRRPSDLGLIDWTFDAKDRSITEMESLWSKLVLPFVQSSSLSAPLAMADWCDYSAFDVAFLMDGGTPSYLRPYLQPTPRARERPLDVRKLLARLQFSSSAETPGLQMADIAVSIIRRALVGNLKPDGWRRLGSVMIRPASESEVVRVLSLHPSRGAWSRPESMRFLREVRQTALPMVAEE
jgi:hypothetical protein